MKSCIMNMCRLKRWFIQNSVFRSWQACGHTEQHLPIYFEQVMLRTQLYGINMHARKYAELRVRCGARITNRTIFRKTKHGQNSPQSSNLLQKFRSFTTKFDRKCRIWLNGKYSDDEKLSNFSILFRTLIAQLFCNFCFSLLFFYMLTDTVH